MFFRLKKSSDRAYVQIVENKRIDGAVRQNVIATLGRGDELAVSGALASLLASGAKLTDQVLLISALDEEEGGALSASAKRIGVSIRRSTQAGGFSAISSPILSDRLCGF